MLKWLKDILGEDAYTDDIDAKVSKEIGERFVAKDRYNTLKAEKDQLEGTVKDRDNQLAALKAEASATDALKLKIAEMETANQQADAKHKAELEALKVDAAVYKELTAAKAKNQKAVKALLDLTSATLEEDGTVKGLKAQIDALKEAEDTKFLFDDGKKPGIKGTEPGQGSGGSSGSGGGAPSSLTKADFYRLSYEQRVQLKESDPELYNKLKG